MTRSCKPQPRSIGFRMSCVTPREQIKLFCPTLGKLKIAEKLARAASLLTDSFSHNVSDGAREEKVERRPQASGERRSEFSSALLSPFSTLLLYCRAAAMEAAIRSVGGASNAMLIKRVYEVDPLCCPECGGQMKVVSFIEPPQADVIEQILRHCGLWQSTTPRAPPDVEDLVLELDAAYGGNSIDSRNQTESSQELTYVDIDTFLATRLGT